ncbi:hypothetical protein BSKO_00135 [Bryopsis sp. KO-2023]|nr:hypothetical protein BSKO_00135 [Bryopsis sp. KO-2023]
MSGEGPKKPVRQLPKWFINFWHESVELYHFCSRLGIPKTSFLDKFPYHKEALADPKRAQRRRALDLLLKDDWAREMADSKTKRRYPSPKRKHLLPPLGLRTVVVVDLAFFAFLVLFTV